MDRADQERILRAAWREAGIRPELARVGAHYGMPAGRAWADMPDADVDLLYRHTVGGEPLPPATDPTWTPDESPGGVKFNADLPF